MKYTKLSKKEVKNIILDKNWDERREKLKKRADKHSQQCKEWKEQEKKILKGEQPKPKRRSSYLPPSKQAR